MYYSPPPPHLTPPCIIISISLSIYRLRYPELWQDARTGSLPPVEVEEVEVEMVEVEMGRGIVSLRPALILSAVRST